MKQCIHHGNKQGIYQYCYRNKHNSYDLLRENQYHLLGKGCENKDTALLLLRRWKQKEIKYSVAKWAWL